MAPREGDECAPWSRSDALQPGSSCLCHGGARCSSSDPKCGRAESLLSGGKHEGITKPPLATPSADKTSDTAVHGPDA